MKLLAFDLDKTLLSKNSSFEFCRYLQKKGFFSFYVLFLSFIYYIRHRYLKMTLEELHQSVFRHLLKGLSYPDLTQYVERFVEEKIESFLYMPAFERLRRAQHQGHFTLILSNSPDFLVSAFARKLQVDNWKSSEYRVDKDQRLCQISFILQGQDKAFYLEEVRRNLQVAVEEVIAYSDSHLDLAFLSSAGHAVAVNPDRELKKISQEKGWEQI